MPLYISLMKLTDQGIKDMKSFSKRFETSTAFLKQLGAKLVGFYSTMGEYDYVAIADAPLIHHKWLRKGSLLCALTDHSNFDFKVTKNANKIIVDNTYSTMHLGELSKWVDQGLISEKDLYAEIGEIVLGKKKGRETEDELILYVPIGMGSLDVATATEVFRLSTEKELGKLLTFV